MNTRLSTLTAALVLASGTASADFVINDDLIVDGSACIGFDCVNGESFSFDTIRLKENNLRIKFEDTSTAASFPTTDWQLTANASANGGASKFSIDDISGSRTPFTVEANARSNALYVDDGGRIGSRTATPSVEIHTIDGDTPTLRLQQDGSSGFQPQTWDVAGNETNFFIRDVTNGSTLPFRIRPTAPTSSIFIDVDGDVGIGTSSPDNSLHIDRTNGTAALFIQERSGTVDVRTLLKMENNGGSSIDWINTDTGTDWKMNTNNVDQFIISEVGATNPGKFILEDNGGDIELGLGRTPGHPIHHVSGAHLTAAGVWTNASSRSLKKNIRELGAEDAVAAIRELKPVRYEYKRDKTAESYIGFIAEDVPELVAQNDRKSLSPMDMVALLTRVVQQQDATISTQKADIQELEARLDTLEKSLK
jgi:hypothetical protein